MEALTGTLAGGKPMLSRTVGGMVPESEVADLLEATERAHEGCQIGSYPFFKQGRVGANFVVRSTDQAVLEACAGELLEALRARGHDVVDGQA